MNTKVYRKVSGILVGMIILFLFFSLFNISFAQDVKPLKIGVVYPMSGATAFVSEGIYIGHQVAAKEIMEEGGFLGRPVEFILRDDGGKPELNTRYCRELILKEGVEWLLSGYGTTVSLAAAGVAAQYKVPVLNHGGVSEIITVEEGNRYAFRYCYTSRDEGRQMAKIVAEEMTKDIENPKVYWFAWDQAFGRDVYKYFVPELKRLRPDVKLVGESWPRAGETDYAPFISHMVSLQPDVIVNGTWAGGIIAMLKQGSARGLWDISQLIGVSELAGPEFRQFLGNEVPVGAWGNTYDDPTWPDNEKQRKLYDLYYSFTGKPRTELPPGELSTGYYMVHLINAAMEKAGTSETEEVIIAMEGITIDSHWGPITVRDFDHQVLSYNLWGTMIEEEGLPYKVLDKERMFITNTKDSTYTEEEWLARRKAVGKGYLEF